MAQIQFTFANGSLTVVDGGGLYSFNSADYRVRSIWNHTKLRIVIYPILHELTPATRREWETDDVAEWTLNGTQYATTELFVNTFNAYAGTNIGFNTKYPEIWFSQTIELDTSVDEQVVPVWCQLGHNAGWVTISAPSTNTGNIYFGESDVSNESDYLEPTEARTIELSDLSLIWVQSTTPGDVVRVHGAAKI